MTTGSQTIVGPPPLELITAVVERFVPAVPLGGVCVTVSGSTAKAGALRPGTTSNDAIRPNKTTAARSRVVLLRSRTLIMRSPWASKPPRAAQRARRPTTDRALLVGGITPSGAMTPATPAGKWRQLDLAQQGLSR